MAYSKKLVKRTDSPSGDEFILQEAPALSEEYAQGVVFIDDLGNPAGHAANPLRVGIVGIVSTSSAPGVSFSSGPSAVDNTVITTVNNSVLRELRCILKPSTTVSRYLMLFNADSLPANGAAPIWRMLVPAGGEASETFNPGLSFSEGIVAAISSTDTTLTVTTGSEGYIHAIRE